MLINRVFAKHNPLFQKSCELAGIPVTTRQASKFRDKRGKAYVYRTEAQKTLEEEKKYETECAKKQTSD